MDYVERWTMWFSALGDVDQVKRLPGYKNEKSDELFLFTMGAGRGNMGRVLVASVRAERGRVFPMGRGY